MTRIPLSVLDLAPVATGASIAGTLRHSTELAQVTERLGYHRYWVAEHHNMPGIASASPAVLVAHLAQATRTLRIGSGGVMLPNHRPLVVAEQFGTLEALHPGRIDLGIGRAPGADPFTARALQGNGAGIDDFPSQLAEVRSFLQDSFPPGHPYARIHAVPARDNVPAVWLLGTSEQSALLAARMGLPFAFAHHFNPTGAVPALAQYREAFLPSDVLPRARAMLAVDVVCAETEDRARFLAGPAALSLLRLRQGRPSTLPSPEEAAHHEYDQEEREIVRSLTAAKIVGEPEQVQAALDHLVRATGVQELMVATATHDARDRIRSYALLAERYGLGASSAGAPSRETLVPRRS